MKNARLVLSLLFFVLIGLSDCAKPKFDAVQVLRIDEGEHAAKPYHFEWKKTSYRAYRWKFTSSCIYDHGNSDQCDWNKLTGDACEIATNHENSLMDAWRWDVVDSVFYLAPYYHKNGTVYHPPGVPCSDPTHQADTTMNFIAVGVDEWFVTEQFIDAGDNSIATTVTNDVGDFFSFTVDFDDNFRRTREIGPWFGGSLPAPQDMIILRLLLAED